MAAATASYSPARVLISNRYSPSRQILPCQRYTERIPGTTLTQAASRRATISRAMVRACSSSPTVVTTTIAFIGADVSRHLACSQMLAGTAPGRRRGTAETALASPPGVATGIPAQHPDLAGAAGD